MTIRIAPRALLVASLALIVAVTLFWLGSGPAQGAAAAAAVAKARTFVSTKGLDTNTCGAADPCRTISRALVETSAGGEVVVLDSGGYGPFTIDKSVTVNAVGVYAGITATSGNAITITAGATDKVALRGLTMNGLGGERGIYATSVGQLYLEELNVKNFSFGIDVRLSASATVFISDTVASGNGFYGLVILSTAGTLRGSVTDSRFERNGDGLIVVGGGTRVVVSDSVANGNNATGFIADNSGTLNVERSVSSFNNVGLSSSTNGTLRASETFVTGNTFGVFNFAGSHTISFGNNRIHGNTESDGAFSDVTVAQK